ncbi:MAG: hypothetical protein AAFX92_12785 [Pseudomonadota bacterium]
MKTALPLALTIAFGVGSAAAQYNSIINEADQPQFLFTMSADSGSYANGALVLQDVPVVVYFSDRPYRMSGTITPAAFAQEWNEQTDVFRSDPPNATMSILTEDGASNVVVELSELTLDHEAGTMTFETSILMGDMPASFGVATLFIDSFHFGPNPGDGAVGMHFGPGPNG